MLNEIKEFDQYTFSLSCEENYNKEGRLRYRDLRNKLSGITRAMTIIARHYLFENGENADEEAIEKARVALKLWCGAKNIECPKDMEQLKDWLPTYVRNYLMKKHLDSYADKQDSDCIPTEVNELINQICDCSEDEQLQKLAIELKNICESNEDKEFGSLYNRYIKPICTCISTIKDIGYGRKRFGKSIFDFEPTSKDDFKAVTYDSIIATALNAGPLKQYYLYCNDINIPLIYDLKEKERDMVLKTAAAFLLNKCPEQKRYVFIVKADVSNWMKERPKEYILPKIHDENGKEIAVFNFHEHEIKKNALKLYIKPSWIEHFSLIEKEDIDKIDKKTGVFFRDDGSHSYLVENTIY